MRDLAKFLYTHNPFYLLSAASVLFGLRSAFDNGGTSTATNAWMLAGALAGYALLLAATAVLIVRVGKVWDDARTIALLVVLMVLAISSSFDRLCLDAPTTAIALFAASGVFALVTIEGLIRGLQLAFPWSARIPLYLLIILFFAYPPAINHSLWDSLGLSLPWRVLCFPICAATLTMTLLPVVWRSSQQFQNSGSPWIWPWYPWSVFFFVGVGICGRSYLMTLAFQVNSGLESTFGGYYLVPMGFAILILLSEMAIVEKSKALRDLLLIGPFCLMVLALIPGGRAYSVFLFEFTRTLGSPLWLTVIGCLLFSVYFYLRHAEQKTAMIQAVLLAMTFIAPSDTRMPTLFPQNWWPLAIVSVIQFLILARDRNSVRFLKGWIASVAALGIWVQQHAVTGHDGILLGHTLLMGILLAGLIFADPFAKWLRARLPLPMVGLPVVAASASFFT